MGDPFCDHCDRLDCYWAYRAITAARYIADYACVCRFDDMFVCAYARSET